MTDSRPTAEAAPTNRLPSLGITPAWRTELFRLLLALAAGGGLWWWTGHLTIALLPLVVGYLGWHAIQVVRLWRWLEEGRLTDMPEASGLWGDVFEGIYKLKRRNRKRKKRLASIVSEFRASTAALPDAAVVINKDDEVVWFNQAAETLYGLSSPADSGASINELINSAAFTRYLRTLPDEAVEGSESVRSIEIASPIDQAMTLSVRVVPYGNQQRLLIGRDVTQLRRLEQTRRDFVANASHELRTPLTVLRGYLDLMYNDPGDQLLAWRVPLKEMQQQSLRMERIISDLLKLARMESNSLEIASEPVNVSDLLHALEDEARDLSRGAHHIVFDVEPDLDLIGRPGELYSALSNLVFNALQYTPSGGEVAVRWWADGAGAHFAVKDTGIGIPEADIPRLTERFYRADEARSRETGGTGLGLAIVKHAAERHDGSLDIRSTPGQGSVFAVHFPAERISDRSAD